MNSGLVHPCNPASFHAAQSDCLLLPVKVATGILMLAQYTDHNNVVISLQEINHMSFNRKCTDVFPQFRPESADIIFTQNLKNTG